MKVSIDSFNSEFFSSRNEAFTNPGLSQANGDKVRKLMREVLPELNKTQERLDRIAQKMVDNIYSKTNADGCLLGKFDDYNECVQLRIKKLRV